MAGTGVEKVPDGALARRLLDKVNQFNLATGVKAVAVALLFSASALLDPLADGL